MAKKPAPQSNGKAWPAEQVVKKPIGELIPYARNAKIHTDEQVAEIVRAIRDRGFTNPVLIDEEGLIIAGHARVLALKELGASFVPCVVAVGWTEEQKRAHTLFDNKAAEKAQWNDDMLRIELGELQALGVDLSLTGFDVESVSFLTGLNTGGQAPAAEPGKLLAERFGAPPFSVLNAREGWWQDRKRAWIALGIQSELGRGENLLQFSDSVKLDGKAYNERFKKKGGRKKDKAAVPGGGEFVKAGENRGKHESMGGAMIRGSRKRKAPAEATA